MEAYTLLAIFLPHCMVTLAINIGYPCKTVRGIRGTCTALADCSHLLKEVLGEAQAGKISYKLVGDPCVHGNPSGVCCSSAQDKMKYPEYNNIQPSYGLQEKPVTTMSSAAVMHENRRLLPETSCGQSPLSTRLLGANTTVLGDYPWMALLGSINRKGVLSYDCGGSLISVRYVLTAAHCLRSSTRTAHGMKLTTVRLGEWDQLSELDCDRDGGCAAAEEFGVEDWTTHQGWLKNSRNSANDIGLVRLDRDVQFTKYISPICLPLDSVAETEFVGRRAIVSGWGKTDNGPDSYSNVLLQLMVPVVDFSVCSTFFRSFSSLTLPSSGQLCAGGEEGRDSCNGDSGSPLQDAMVVDSQVRWFILGIVSGGTLACGVKDRPSIYTKVPDYIGWILDHIKS